MALQHFVLLLFLPVVCLAQSPDKTQERMIKELTNIRVAVERLEKSHSVLAALTRLQIYESRLATLAAEKQGLLSEERDLTSEIARIAPVVAEEIANNIPRLVQLSPGAEPVLKAEPSPTRIRHTEATQRLEDVRRRIQMIEEASARTRRQVEVLEKSLGEDSQ
jgi:hypothetical protein